MHVDHARRILGVRRDDDAETVRSAYRHLLLRHHPDVSLDRDATDRTVELTVAYTTLMDATAAGVTDDQVPAPSTVGSTPKTPRSPVATARVAAHLVGDDTIAVQAPPDETLMAVIDAAHDLGEIVYLDPSAGLIEVIIEFVEAPTSSVLLTLQGRATGSTEVVCTVEPLSGGEAPASAAVTRLLLHTLVNKA